MKNGFLWRGLTLTVGLLLMALGIVCCIRARLGITPISCPPYVLSLGLSPTVGQFTIAMHLLLILGQMLLLRKDFQRLQALQILLALVFGCFIDGWMACTGWMEPAGYPMCVLLLLAGNVLMAVGMCFEMKARFLLVPTDGFVQAVSRRSGCPFSRVKVAFDVSLLLVSVVCSWLLLGCIRGIREGTFLSAFLVGFLVGLFRRWADRLRAGRGKSGCPSRR